MVDVTHVFTGLPVGGSVEDSIPVLVPIVVGGIDYSNDRFVGSTPAGGLRTTNTAGQGSMILDTTNVPTSADYSVEASLKTTQAYQNTNGLVVRGNSTTGACYVLEYRNDVGYRIRYSSGGRYPTYRLVAAETNQSPAPIAFTDVQVSVFASGSDVGFLVSVGGAQVLSAVDTDATKITATGFAGVLASGSSTEDVQIATFRIHETVAGDANAPVEESAPTLNTSKWYPQVDFTFSDVGSATITAHVVSVPQADNTPTKAQIKAGTNSADVDVGTGKKQSLTVNQNVAGTLALAEDSVSATKLCLFVEDEALNQTAIYIVNSPARGTTGATGMERTTTIAAFISQPGYDGANPSNCIFLLSDGPSNDAGFDGNTLAINPAAQPMRAVRMKVIGYDAAGHADGDRRVIAESADPGFVLAAGQEVELLIGYPTADLGAINGVQLIGDGSAGDNIRPQGIAAS